ncbi:MAG: type VI secretion system baseplate subunit TssK, partial [Verrucomicrobiota bacterium]
MLQPHHLQSMQRMVLNRLSEERGLLHPFHYGVVEFGYRDSELQNENIVITRLVVVMPDGTVLKNGENMELPGLDLKNEDARNRFGSSFMVYLGLPRLQDNRANVVDPEKEIEDPATYRVYKADLYDENTGKNNRPIWLRRYNAQLLLEPDRNDMDVVPLMKIQYGVGGQSVVPRIDDEYAPPCLVLQGSGILMNKLTDLTNAMESVLNQLDWGEKVGAGISDAGDEDVGIVKLSRILRVRTLARYVARFKELTATKGEGIAPFPVFLGLRELLCELATLQFSENRELIEKAASYEHVNLASSFGDIIDKIRSLLPESIELMYEKFDFIMKGPGYYELEQQI